MPSPSRMELLNSMAALKRADKKAYNALLLELNIQKWQDVSVDDYGRAIATCRAALGDGEISNDAEDTIAELADDPKLSVHDTLDRAGLARNAKSEITAGIGDDIATVINGAPSIAEGFNAAARMLHARAKNRAQEVAK